MLNLDIDDTLYSAIEEIFTGAVEHCGDDRRFPDFALWRVKTGYYLQLTAEQGLPVFNAGQRQQLCDLFDTDNLLIFNTFDPTTPGTDTHRYGFTIAIRP